MECREWLSEQGLPEGEYEFELTDPDSGEPLVILDLAWPNGLQEGLSGPVALLLGEEPVIVGTASSAGYRCFTDAAAFRQYVSRDVLGATDAIT